MTKEFKNYGLISTKKPARALALSTTVAIEDAREKRYYCYVSFTQKLVEKAGKALPRGISAADPAFLLVRFDTHTSRWVVSAKYVRDGIEAVLWKTDGISPPPWVRFYELKK